jgi:hypothetical protein
LADPAIIPDTTPFVETVATSALLVLQETVVVQIEDVPLSNEQVAVNADVPPLPIDCVGLGEITMPVRFTQIAVSAPDRVSDNNLETSPTSGPVPFPSKSQALPEH